MAANDERRPMRTRVTEDSRAAWQVFARVNGVSVNNLIEALGPALSELERLPSWLRAAIEDARRIDADRRDR